MPRFTIQDNYGRELDIEGDVAPSDEKEIGNLFSEAEKSGFISPIYTPLFDKPSQKDSAFLGNSNLPQTQKSVASSTKVDSGKLLPSSAGIFPDMNTDNIEPSIMIEGYKPVDVTATAPTAKEKYDYVGDINNNPELKKYYQSIPQPESVQYSPRVLQMKKEGKPIGVNPEAMRKGEEYLAGLSAAEFTNLTQEGRLLTSLGKGGLDVLAGVSSAMEWAGIDKAKPITQRMDSWAKEIAPYNPNFAEKLMSGLGSQMVFIPFGFGVGSAAQVMGKFSPKIASLFGASASTLLEAGTNAGLVYKEMLDGGKSVEEASRSARDVFAANIPLDFITNKLGAFAGAEKQGVKRMAGGFVSEYTQEGGQQVISNLATGKPVEEGVGESALIGGVLGGGTGAVTRGFDESGIQNSEVRNQNVGGSPFGYAQGQVAQGQDMGQGGKIVGAENLPPADAEELAKGRVVPIQKSEVRSQKLEGKNKKIPKRSEKEITHSFNDLLELERTAPEKLTERQKEDIDFIKEQRIDGRPDAETQQVLDLQESFENQSSEIRSQGKETLTEVPTELPTEKDTQGNGFASVPTMLQPDTQGGDVVKGKGNVELSDTRVYDVPLQNIGTRPELQNRETAFSEESVKNIVENFDANKLEPIVVWQDPKSGEFITANHSRFEAFKRMGKENIPARVFKGSYEDFVDFAKNSNVLGTPESLLERAKYYRSKRGEGMDEKALRELAKNQEKKNANTILSFSYLNPKGKLLEAVKQLENSDQQNKNAINTMAEWVGEVRKRNSELTNAHENELFDFLREQYGNVGARNKTEFLERVNGAIQKRSAFGEFNSSQPLNLKNFASNSANESQFDEQIATAEQEYKNAEKELKVKREEFLLRKASPQQLESALKPYSDRVTVAQRELLNLQNTKADALRNIRQSEMSLFDSDVKNVGVEKAIENVRERVLKASNKEDLTRIFKEQFGLDDEKANANAVIYDATANALAQQLGKGKEYFYGKLGFGNVEGGSGKGELGQGVESGLYDEARKYKSAEELGINIKEGGHLLDQLENLNIQSAKIPISEFGNKIGLDKRDLTKQTSGKLRSNYWLKKIENGERPVVLVGVKNGKLKVIDGNHKASAYLETGKDIPVVFTSEAKSKLADKKANKKGELYQVDAYHGSPYSFDRFSTEKIGSGERSQAFGWGLYFTDVKDVAKSYANMGVAKYFSENNVNVSEKIRYGLSGILSGVMFNIEKAKQEIAKISGYTHAEKKSMVKLLDMVQKGVPRNFYTVTLHRGKKPSEYDWLQWDEPLTKKQRKIISKVANNLIGNYAKNTVLSWSDTAGNLYEYLSQKSNGGAKSVSLALLKHGIDGIKYSTSIFGRGFNYVVFDENAVSINERELFQKKQGAVRLSEYGDDVISAMTDPNVSTPVHELSHVYLKELLVATRDGVADFRDDLRVVLKGYNENVRGRKIKGEVFVNIEKGIDELLKNPAGSSGRIKDVQEFFARGFEKYLAEGEKAGFSKRMNEIFAKFKMWLSDIYNGIKGSAIDLGLNDGMKKVFGKMVGMEKVEGRSEKGEVSSPKVNQNGEGEGVLYQELIDEIKNEALQLPENERSKFIRDEFIRRRKNATQKSSTEQVVKEDSGLQKIKNKFRKGFDVLREQVQDNFLRVKKLVEDPSMKITEKSNPYDAEILFHGRVGARIEDVQNTVNNISNDILKTSKDIGVEDSVLRNDVNNYLLSLHAPERNARLYNGAAGITTEEAKTLLQDLRNKEYFQDVQRIAGDISSLNKKTLEILHDGEVISDEAYTSMTETYKNHVPLQRIFDDTENINDVLISKGYDVRSSGIRRAKGSSRAVADILTNVVANVEQAIVRSEKNLVDLQTLRFARDNKQSGLFEEVKPKSIGKDFNGNLIFEKIKDDNVLQLREKGKPVYLKINDPNLASALRGVGNEQLPSYMKFIGNFTRFYSGLLTRFNPEFLFSNKIRDLQELMVFALSQGELGKKRVRKILAKDRQSIKDVYDYIRGNDTDGARLYNQMRLDGGTTGGIPLSTRKNLELDLQKLEQINKSSPRKALKMIFKTIDAVNTIFEDSSRLSVYKNALENGLSREKASVLAKNSTINFNKKGRATPIINSLWMFSNASVQGSTKMLIAMKDPKVAAAVTSIVGLLSFLINGWNDKLDPEWRDKVSKFNRNSNFTIMLPTTDGVRYFAVPISWGLKPIKVTADYVYDATTGNLDNFRSALGNITSTFIDAYNPIGGSDVPSAIMPTILDIPLDIWRNKKFTGSPIKPLNYGRKPEHELYFKNLPETIPGKIAIGGTEMLSDIGLEVSPADVVYAYNQYIGGAGGFGGRIMNSIYSIGKGELPQAREVPFLNRFYKNVPQEELNRFNDGGITKKGISRIDLLKNRKGRKNIFGVSLSP